MILALLGGSKAAWYLTRGTGVVSILLLTAVTVLGIVNSVRWSPKGSPRFVLQHLHRNISLLSVVFIVVHVASAVFDTFAPIHWLDAIVPFGAPYRPLWLGLGALAFDLVIAVTVTSLLRARLGFGVWRVVHWTSYACWGIAVFHGLGTGSDSAYAWMEVLILACVASVATATGWRLSDGWHGWSSARISLALGLVVVPLALGGWFVAGPLQPGWAARAGTPVKVLPAAAATTASDSCCRPATAAGTGRRDCTGWAICST